MVTFNLHFIGYLVFLVIFSYVTLKPKQKHPTGWEYYLLITVTGFVVEEITQLVFGDDGNFTNNSSV